MWDVVGVRYATSTGVAQVKALEYGVKPTLSNTFHWASGCRQGHLQISIACTPVPNLVREGPTAVRRLDCFISRELRAELGPSDWSSTSLQRSVPCDAMPSLGLQAPARMSVRVVGLCPWKLGSRFAIGSVNPANQRHSLSSSMICSGKYLPENTLAPPGSGRQQISALSYLPTCLGT